MQKILYRFAYPSIRSACSGKVDHGVNLIVAKFENRLTDFDVELVVLNLEKKKLHPYN